MKCAENLRQEESIYDQIQGEESCASVPLEPNGRRIGHVDVVIVSKCLHVWMCGGEKGCLGSEVGTISVIATTLHYVFALLHKALYLWRIAIASDSYRFRHFAGVIAYDSYRSDLAGQLYFVIVLSNIRKRYHF